MINCKRFSSSLDHYPTVTKLERLFASLFLQLSPLKINTIEPREKGKRNSQQIENSHEMEKDQSIKEGQIQASLSIISIKVGKQSQTKQCFFEKTINHRKSEIPNTENCQFSFILRCFYNFSTNENAVNRIDYRSCFRGPVDFWNRWGFTWLCLLSKSCKM